MTTITLNRREVEKSIGKLDDKMQEKILMSGVEIDSLTENELVLDITPNRTDLLSARGFIRYMSNLLGKTKQKEYKVNKPQKDYKVTIEPSVKKVRPFTACAIVKNLKFDSDKIKEIVEIQEKLHLTLGRKRKKLAIGVYPLEKIKLPIRFLAKKPGDIKFQPLEFPKEITGLQVLSQHPTGREYAHLLEGAEVFPIFMDANNKVLSMPPIINSHETGKISESTKEVFVECSGFNLPYLKKTLNIILCALAEMGGEIYQMQIEDKEKFVSPDLSFQKVPFKIEDIEKTIGMKFTEKDIKANLEKMGIGYEKGVALVPPYRTDVLHWVDLAEDVAIAYGYDNLVPEIPKIATIGQEDETARAKKKIAEILAGLGLLEASSFHLNTKDEVKKTHYDMKDFIEVEDSKTDYSVLRPNLFVNQMKIISENSDSSYPQKIFEIGRVFSVDKKGESETGIAEKERLAISLADEKVNFTELKSILDYLFKMIGKTYKISEIEANEFISGRTGKISLEGKEIGVIGEVSPRVLKNWGINVPVVSLELDIDGLI